jgi:hypothetical protein
LASTYLHAAAPAPPTATITSSTPPPSLTPSPPPTFNIDQSYSNLNGLDAIAKRIRSLILSRRPAATDDSIQGMLS